eukprot:TRINITY_DN25206_c0_g1_i1.p1 TRINITY_DN25206_c0_g1~~TRINITY_DN25206_c0_g1_i1.p1  ORF type:complete len:122 (-),score=2.83 TRINITY_DN25206_c0_g1_i1:80-445(-)
MHVAHMTSVYRLIRITSAQTTTQTSSTRGENSAECEIRSPEPSFSGFLDTASSPPSSSASSPYRGMSPYIPCTVDCGLDILNCSHTIPSTITISWYKPLYTMHCRLRSGHLELFAYYIFPV